MAGAKELKELVEKWSMVQKRLRTLKAKIF